MNFKQKELYEWQCRNFGEYNNVKRCALGMIEEIGEVAHEILKKDENIRGGRNGIDAKKVSDGIADVIIFGLNFMSGKDLPFTKFESDSFYIPKDYDLFEIVLRINRRISKILFRLSCYRFEEINPEFNAIVFLGFRMIEMVGLDPEKEVAEVIEKVMARDWVKYPEKGVADG